MKTILPFLAFAILFQTSHADVPKKAPLVKYTGLWTNSPFTSKPEVIGGPPPANPLDDYTLTGISPVPGGYRITIMSKKDPEDKRVIGPGGTDNEFKVVSVNRNPGVALGTTVVLSTGSMQGTVSFEPDLISLKAAPAAAPPQQANLPPGVAPTAPNGNVQSGAAPVGAADAARQVRPRIVPAPARTPAQPGTQGGSRDSKSQPRIERRR